MQSTKQIVQRLIKQHGTNDPTTIARKMGILILFEDFKNIWGYFNISKRIPMIHVNRNLDEHLQRFVIAHELGHRILHPKVNVPFLRANTFQSIDRIEREANEFAVELLMPDSLLYEHQHTGMTIREAAATYGVPTDVAHLKKF
ncbi:MULTISPECIES: ImmA/IrrE family metallo-endopeptidase [Brevibacillus]|uniref:ImmA/IrrE family metallo-endopeptidase n=1 Tax=Brevibacillus TaxID=55080 RepID=UPI000271B304|nr:MULTISPECIES: ImmA/IrrE family metallo-endopeptidase [Brevibacillus]EJL43992.1 putative Zn peptidase [Brevibacillus sp. CF112]MBY0054098.1 ImmA/IrrE family metallo-endopeptidase [Brevibacillus agri]